MLGPALSPWGRQAKTAISHILKIEVDLKFNQYPFPGWDVGWCWMLVTAASVTAYFRGFLYVTGRGKESRCLTSIQHQPGLNELRLFYEVAFTFITLPSHDTGIYVAQQITFSLECSFSPLEGRPCRDPSMLVEELLALWKAALDHGANHRPPSLLRLPLCS